MLTPHHCPEHRGAASAPRSVPPDPTAALSRLLTLLARTLQLLLQVTPEHPLLRAALLLSLLPRLHGWSPRGPWPSPLCPPKTFALPVPHRILSRPLGLARPQGAGLQTGEGGGWPGQQAAAPASASGAPGYTEVAVEEEAARTLKKLGLVAQAGTRPSGPAQPWGSRKLCSSSNPLPVRASLQPQGLGWGRQLTFTSSTHHWDFAHWSRPRNVRAPGWGGGAWGVGR